MRLEEFFAGEREVSLLVQLADLFFPIVDLTDIWQVWGAVHGVCVAVRSPLPGYDVEGVQGDDLQPALDGSRERFLEVANPIHGEVIVLDLEVTGSEEILVLLNPVHEAEQLSFEWGVLCLGFGQPLAAVSDDPSQAFLELGHNMPYRTVTC